ncbi:TonB-dependent receptor plug domain-containing protein [Lysobacter sp. CA196]|uniref:TonB-dependent receptor plug domain-containing protein n=1 Tax=Lysobacter sp. CA196 TaxID=3455606 RepID=UPI003F8D54D0
MKIPPYQFGHHPSPRLAHALSHVLVTLKFTGALAGAFYVQSAAAQAPAPGGSNEAQPERSVPQGRAVAMDRVVVTGSNIRSVDVAAAQPVITLTAEDIQRQGFATVGQLLQNLSSSAPPDLGKLDVGSTGPNQGGAFFNLRGLGAQRTLVLIDGQRIGAIHGGYTNVDVVPTAIVERIDILANGASAVYGSDALAGVVNIVTKKNFDRGQLDVYRGVYAPGGDGEQGQYGLTFGKSGDKGSVVASVSYQQTRPVYQKDRPVARYPYSERHPYFQLSERGPYGIILNPPAGMSSTGQLVLNTDGDSRNIGDYHPLVRPRFGADGDVHSLADAGDFHYNYTGYGRMMWQGITTTKNFYLDGRYDLTPRLSAHFNTGYNKVVAAGDSSVVSVRSGLGGKAAYPLLLDGASYYNPVPGRALRFVRRMDDVYFRHTNKSTNKRYALGLDGVFDIGERQFDWSVGYNQSGIEGRDYRYGFFDLPKLTQALGPSFRDAAGVVRCGTPGAIVPDCVPFNPLAGKGRMTPEMVGGVMIRSVWGFESEESAYTADLSGALATLQGGDLTFATGAVHRKVSAFSTPDAYAARGLSTDIGFPPFGGRYSLDELYLEFNAPLLKDLPGAKLLAIDAARRWSRYSNFGSTQNSSFKLTWKPVDDLMVRASYGTGFRAPTVTDLYHARYGTGGFTDPCDSVYGPAAYSFNPAVAQRCANGYEGLAAVAPGFRQVDDTGNPIAGPGGSGAVPSSNLTGGNPDLQPERSYNSQLGFVYSPSWIAGFDMSVDWWSYNIRDLIAGIGNNQLLANCYQFSIKSACRQFERRADGQIVNLLNLVTNTGWQKVRGYDFAFNYRLPETRLGQFDLGLQGTYTDASDALSAPGSAVEHRAGIAAVWRVRSNVNLGWSWRRFGANWTVRHFSSYKAACAFPPPDGKSAFPCTDPEYYAADVGISPKTRVASVAFHDLQLHWNAPWDATVSVGANNLFNRVGPYVYGAFNSGTDTYASYNASYDIGRYLYLQYQQKF